MKNNYSSFLFILLVTLISFSSCNKCSEMACTTGPPSLSLQLLDKDTDESVFLSGRFKPQDIQVSDGESKPVYFSYVTVEEMDFLHLNFDSNEGIKEIKLTLSPTFSIPLEVEIEKRRGDCCTNSFVKDVKSSNYPLDSTESETLKIRL